MKHLVHISIALERVRDTVVVLSKKNTKENHKVPETTMAIVPTFSVSASDNGELATISWDFTLKRDRLAILLILVN